MLTNSKFIQKYTKLQKIVKFNKGDTAILD